AAAGGVVASLKREQPQQETFLSALGAAHCLGVPVAWQQVLAGKFVELPKYPFPRQRYWFDAGMESKMESSARPLSMHPLLADMTVLAEGEGYLFTGRLSLADQPWLADHQVFNKVLLPGAAFLEMAWVAAESIGRSNVAELTLAQPIVLPEQTAVKIQL